jgi:hypothetical protein
MKLRSLKGLLLTLFGTACLLGLNFSLCGPTSPTTHTTIKDLIIKDNQITGWILDTVWNDSAMPFTDATANDFVDGGKIDYCGSCNGTGPLKTGIATYFINPQKNHKLRAFVLDYGTASGAKTEFDVWVNKNKASASTEETISPFSNTTAIGFDIGGGLNVFANFSNYYVELKFNNYDSSSLAVPDASTFLNYYNSKIK